VFKPSPVKSGHHPLARKDCLLAVAFSSPFSIGFGQVKEEKERDYFT